MQVSVYAKALDGVMGESDFEFTPETIANAIRGTKLTSAEALTTEIRFDSVTGERFQDWVVCMRPLWLVAAQLSWVAG